MTIKESIIITKIIFTLVAVMGFKIFPACIASNICYSISSGVLNSTFIVGSFSSSSWHSGISIIDSNKSSLDGVYTVFRNGVASYSQFPAVGGCIKSLVTVVFNANLKFLGEGWSELPNLFLILPKRFSRLSWLILLVSRYLTLYGCISYHKFFRAARLEIQPFTQYSFTFLGVQTFHNFMYSEISSVNFK